MEILDRAIAEAYERGYLGRNILASGFDFDLCTHTGAGSYECGEESALMESLEGKRGYPRIRPPFPAVVGLYGSPTVINNVETLSAVPEILRRGADWYASLGSPRNGGTRLFCISGHVNKPGIYELPMGFPLRQMIEDVAGGIPGGKNLKAVIPGGSSCPLLKADETNVPMDFDSVAKAGSMLGSGGVVVIDEDTCMVDVARRIMHFYAHESCGWCIPCREGTGWLRQMLDRFHEGAGRAEDIPLIGELAQNMLGKTFCPLGDAAAMPTISIVKKWAHEFEQHLSGKCPYRRAGALVAAR
jgi:NADH-quinone oxidoreductase subunit F